MIPHDGSGGRVELAGTLARGLMAWCPILRGRSPQKYAQVTKPELRVISTKKSRTRNDRAAKTANRNLFRNSPSVPRIQGDTRSRTAL